jgi:hypothetical protein
VSRKAAYEAGGMGWRDDPWLRGFESGYGAGYRDALEGRDTRQGRQARAGLEAGQG